MNTKYRLDRLQFLTPPTFQPSLAFFSQITVAVPFFLAPFSLASALDALLGTSCLTLASFSSSQATFPMEQRAPCQHHFWCSWSLKLVQVSRVKFLVKVPGHHHPGACHVLFPRPRHRPRPRLLGRFRGFERFGVTFGFSETEGFLFLRLGMHLRLRLLWSKVSRGAAGTWRRGAWAKD